MNLQNLIAFFENKTAIEIGGPSLWMNYLYAHLKSIVYFNSKDGMKAYSESYNQSNSVNIHFGDIVNADEIAAFKNNFDLCFSSHVLEHIANPIKALHNCRAVLNKSGMLITVVPNKLLRWDRERPYTSMLHLLEDFNNNTSESDLTHLHESSCMIETRPTYYADVGETNDKRVMHHHVFSREILQELHEFCGFKTIFCGEIQDYPLHLTYIGYYE